jgi:hypothetical protein
MKLEDAEEMAERMNAKVPDGVHYEVMDSTDGQLVPDEEPEFGGFYVKRIVERGRVNT